LSITKSASHLRSWITIGIIVLAIIGFTALFIFFDDTKRIPPPSSGWKTVRPPYAVLALAEQADVIWAGGAEGLFRLDRFTGDLLPADLVNYPEQKYIRDLCVDHTGGLWIAHETGLTMFKDGRQRTFTANDGLPGGYCAAVIEDKDNNIWVGTETGMAKFDGQDWHDYTDEAGFGKITVSIIFQDSRGTLWFGSDSLNNTGLMRYDGDKWSSFPAAEDLIAHNTINDIFEDIEGNLWVGSGLGTGGGASCIKESGVITLTMEDGLRGPRVRSVFQDNRGRMWFGSEFEGSEVFDGQNKFPVTPDQGLAGWEVMEMVQDKAGVLWLATENGISRIPNDYVFSAQ
jgi:ligand-binding sensor domain-containing protein